MVPWLFNIPVWFFIRFVFMVMRLLLKWSLLLFWSLDSLLFSTYRPTEYLLVLVFPCTLSFIDMLSVLLSHIGTRYPLIFYIDGLIVDGGKNWILCESVVSIFPVVLAVWILFLWSSKVWSSIILCLCSISTWLLLLIHLLLWSHSIIRVAHLLWMCPTIR